MGNQSFQFKIGHFHCMAINDADSEIGCNPLLIQTGQHNVLIDTGTGDAISPPGLLLERLRAAGIAPAEIDMVIVSHADADHIGGAVDEGGKVAFPKAQYMLSRAEWDFWASKPQRVQPSEVFDEAFCRWASTLPVTRLHRLREQLQLIDAETELMPGIRVIEAAGHTPGMLAITISSEQEQLLFIADVLYPEDLAHDPSDSAKAIVSPAVVHSWFDYDLTQAVITRDRLFAQAADQQTLLMAYHLPFPGLGYIAQHRLGWQWTSLQVPA
jgi:glyoxylase-like metal-dependent hydrolase (beta-lactamase superfamily II)